MILLNNEKIKTTTKIPFDKDGNQQHYPQNFYDYKNGIGYTIQPTFRDNFEFLATFKVADYERGRSAVYFLLEDVLTGKKATMFVKDFMNSITKLYNGNFTGTFTFCKRGANFGIKML